MAATVDTDASDEEPESAGSSPGGKRLWIPGILVLAAVGAGTAWIATRGSGGSPGNDAATVARESSAPDAKTEAITADDASPPLDATPSLAVDAARTDARPATRTRRDAGTRARVTADAAGVPGTLRISTSPWATVSIPERGQVCTETPCTIRLPAGTYNLSLKNPVAGVSGTARAVVRAGETTTIQTSLTRRPP